MQFHEYLSQASIWCVLIPLLTGCWYIRKLDKDSMIILGIVACATVPQLLREFIMPGPLLNIAYNLYSICEIVLMFILFLDKITYPKLRMIFNITTIAAGIYCLLMIAWHGFPERFINELAGMNNLIYTVWILLVILEQYETEEGRINKEIPFFWYLIGLLLYAPCTILVFSLWDYIKQHPDSILNQLFSIQSIFNITMYTLFTIGILKSKPVKQYRHPHL